MEKYGTKNSSPKVDGKRAAKGNDYSKLLISIKISQDKIHFYPTENISFSRYDEEDPQFSLRDLGVFAFYATYISIVVSGLF